MVNDNESWVYQVRANVHGRSGSTGVMTEWQKFVQNQVKLPGSMTSGTKLICIDGMVFGIVSERLDIRLS